MYYSGGPISRPLSSEVEGRDFESQLRQTLDIDIGSNCSFAIKVFGIKLELQALKNRGPVSQQALPL
jgi:hypothetical protein